MGVQSLCNKDKVIEQGKTLFTMNASRRLTNRHRWISMLMMWVWLNEGCLVHGHS